MRLGNVVSENRIDDLTSGTRYRKGKVHAEIVRGNIPVRNGVIHLIKRPLVIIDTTIYEVLQVLVSCISPPTSCAALN